MINFTGYKGYLPRLLYHGHETGPEELEIARKKKK